MQRYQDGGIVPVASVQCTVGGALLKDGVLGRVVKALSS